jgi:Tfp pilus assembly protein FimV
VEMSAVAAHPGITSGVRPGSFRPVRRQAPVRRASPSRRTGAAPEGRLHLTRRGRVVVTLLGLAVVLAGAVGGRAVADGPEQATEVTTHAVMSGETLWQIAADVAAPGEDVRDVVLRLQDLNGLANGSLQAGQVVLIPTGS